MALVKCPECRKEISDKASACPHCGFPILNENTIGDNFQIDTNNESILEPEQSSSLKKSNDMKKKVIVGGTIFGVVFIGVFMIILHNFNSESLIRNVKWNMNLEQVQKAEENYSGEVGQYSEEYGQYAVLNIEQFGEKCSVSYVFEDDKLVSIFFSPVYNTYNTAADIVKQLYIAYGNPSEVEIDTEDTIPRSILTWYKDKYQIEMLYIYDNNYISSSLGITFKPYEGKDECTPFEERICTAGSKAIIPCRNVVLPWSEEHCYEHGCFVFGCTEYVYTNSKGYGVCTWHREMY